MYQKLTVNHKKMRFALVIATLSLVHAQDSFLGSPNRLWEVTVPPMGEGNGVVVEPDNKAIFATSSDGTITALDPDDGEQTWNYQPSASNGSVPLSSNSQVAISSDKKFMVYSVTESEDSEDAIWYVLVVLAYVDSNGILFYLNGIRAHISLTLYQHCHYNYCSKVVKLGSPAGDLLWISGRLEGKCSGTPVISNDGKLIFLTHNSNRGRNGHFSILDGAKGRPLFSRQNTVAPYAPPGYVWNPTQGNFEDNQNNKRDVIIWSYMPVPDADEVGPGRTFAFQLKSDFNNNTGDFEVDVLGPEVDWQSTTAPLITAKGLSMYWSVSRSKLRAWVRSANATGDDGKFDQSRTADYDFPRGDPAWLAGFSTPQVDNDETPKILCVGGADPDFACLNANTLAEEWTIGTDSLIKAEARFSTKGDRVYFIEEDGTIQSYNSAAPITKHWEQQVSNNVVSNFDLSTDGGVLYYGDVAGKVGAYQLSSTTPPPVTPATREPSAAPSNAPPSSPSAPTASRQPSSPTPRPTSTTSGGGVTAGTAVTVVLGVASLAAAVLVL